MVFRTAGRNRGKEARSLHIQWKKGNGTLSEYGFGPVIGLQLRIGTQSPYRAEDCRGRFQQPAGLQRQSSGKFREMRFNQLFLRG